jgi:type IV pilus assembly protein PilM
MPVLSTLQKVFPPPRYMSFPCVGVDISDSSLKYVLFERGRAKHEGLSLKSWGDIGIDVGVVERGKVHNVSALTEALKRVKEETNEEYVAVSLPEERAYLFETSLGADVRVKEIRSTLEFKLEENVPLSPRDAYFDYDIVKRDPVTGEVRVAVAVYSRDTINAYYEACTVAGLMPLSFEIEAAAIARASVERELRGTYLIVDFGKSRMGVGIVHKGILMYTSTIEISGHDMSNALRAVLGDRPEAELTEIKNTRGLMHSKENEAVANVLESLVVAMADELSIRMHYWHTRDVDREEREIQRVILCGGSSNLHGLPEFLSAKLSIPVERAQVWQNAFSLDSFIPPITRRYSYGYATAIGLALREFTNAV